MTYVALRCQAIPRERCHIGGYDLTERKALVTGGARGLGAGMADALAQAGAAVVIADIREDLGKATADALRGSGATVSFVPLDVTSDTSWEQAITALQAGNLPCSRSEASILYLAASLASTSPVTLQDVITGLDQANIHLVLNAVRHAGGRN